MGGARAFGAKFWEVLGERKNPKIVFEHPGETTLPTGVFMCETSDERFLEEGSRRGLTLQGLFGVFYYRSANPKTLNALRGFLPVPAEELTREFGAGATAEEVCARSIRELAAAGVRHFYVSNLPLGKAGATLQRILTVVKTG